ncbi:MAG: Leucinerich repeat protein-like protein [Flavipsychrobacter sp.]|nr:Leucinerich repeat protein-like protein [Flavipsychrobacter sp.]
MKKLILFVLLLPSLVTAQTISTIAGTGKLGDSGYGGMATAADMHYPMGITYDRAGGFYFTNHDHANFCIRRIDPAGIYTKYAGTGLLGHTGDGGPATAATFNDPFGLCIDKAGNLLIAEGDNSVIRKINTTTGIISTVVGKATMGYSGDGGQATAAELNSPSSVKTDTAGNMYIADQLNNVVRRVSKTGIITTIAGNNSLGAGYSGDGGPATAAQMNWPADVAIDTAGNIYISDFKNNVIRMVGKNDTIYTVIGTTAGGIPYGGDGGPATAAHLWGPLGLALDSTGNLLIADSYNNRIRKVTPGKIITTAVGTGAGSTSSIGYYSGDGGPATAAEIYLPTNITIGAAGSFYFTDEGNNVIRKVDTVTPKNPLATEQTHLAVTNNIVISPNPNKGCFTIQGSLSLITDETIVVKVINISGQIVYQNSIVTKKGVVNTSITLKEDVRPGIYLLELKAGDTHSVIHFLVDK